MIQGHAIVGERIQAGFDGGVGTILADFRAFAGHQILCRIDQIIGHPRFVDLRECAQRRGRVASFLIPVAAGPIRSDKGLDELHRLDFRKIINVGLASQAAEVGLFP